MITAETMSYEDMKKAAASSVCGECGGRLNVAWVKGGYVLRCANLEHSTITRHVESPFEKERKKEQSKMNSTALTTMTEAQMIDRINTARFPQELTVVDKKILATVARAYGLDPLMKEVTIYQGNAFVSIDGRYRKAQETGELDGVESRPATKEERAGWNIPESDYFFRAEVYRKGSSHAFVGWGRVRGAEINPQGKFKPVDVNPQRMAEKRAEAQALRKAFNIPLPSAEMAGTPDQEEERGYPVDVDQNTGEVRSEVLPPEKPKVKRDTKAEAPFDDSSPQSPIDLMWLRESLAELQTKKISGWSNASVLAYLQNTYKVEGKSVTAAVCQLTKEQAEEFTKRIQDTMQMA